MLCRYEKTIFKSDKGFCIFAYSTSDESVPKEARNRSYYHDDKIHFTAIGYHLIATDAVEVELDGTWENSKHGLQLSVSMCKEVVPRDQAGILAYLSSGIIKGIGPETAKAIVARFGDKTMEVLEKEPDRLLSVKGIAQKKLKAIIKSYEETKALSDLMIYLAPFGVSMKKVAMIREEFGDNSLRIVKTDPFQLCKIKGFGFMTVDSIARKTKVSLKHPLRYSGAINYVLDEARVSGHLFVSVDETVGQCYELLNMGCDDEVVSEEEIRQAITNERVESRIYVEGSRVYLSYERMCEVKSAKRIVSMILQEGFTKIDDLDSKIDNAERTLHQRLAPSQRNAVKLCLSHPISIMTGGPGSGKTTTLRFILDIYKAAFPANEVLLAAPTGRASRRMAEQTGMYASTLHSALGLVTDEDSPLNDKELLSADLVVVDEFSMVDMRLAYILLDRIKSGAQLIIVGDADQLPSVGAGNVLREMIRSEKVPTAVLETVFRQASNSRIITNAYAINHNDTHLQFGDRKPRSNVALLSGLLRCGECGDYMRPKLTGRTNANGELIYTYMCSTKERSHGTVCSMKNCNGNTLDAKIVEEIRKVATDKKDFGQLLSKTKKVINDNKASYEAELTLLVKNHAETEARIKRLVESLSVASDTSAKYVMEQIDELHRQSEQEQTRIAELEKLARQSNALSQNLFFYRDMIESFADTVDSTTIEERRRLLRTIVKKVVWDGKNVYVYLFAEDGELNLPPIGQLMCPSGEDSE